MSLTEQLWAVANLSSLSADLILGTAQSKKDRGGSCLLVLWRRLREPSKHCTVRGGRRAGPKRPVSNEWLRPISLTPLASSASGESGSSLQSLIQSSLSSPPPPPSCPVQSGKTISGGWGRYVVGFIFS